MFKNISLALLAGASLLVAGSHQAAAIDAAVLPEPSVIYANQPVPPAPVRTAYAERSSMGGGFIEFLFGEGSPQGERYQQQPGYGYGSRRSPLPPMDPQQSMRQQEDLEPA